MYNTACVRLKYIHTIDVIYLIKILIAEISWEEEKTPSR
jgi:hypothetical protein